MNPLHTFCWVRVHVRLWLQLNSTDKWLWVKSMWNNLIDKAKFSNDHHFMSFLLWHACLHCLDCIRSWTIWADSTQHMTKLGPLRGETVLGLQHSYFKIFLIWWTMAKKAEIALKQTFKINSEKKWTLNVKHTLSLGWHCSYYTANAPKASAIYSSW